MKQSVLDYIAIRLGRDDATDLLIEYAELTSYPIDKLDASVMEKLEREVESRKKHHITDTTEFSRYSKYNDLLMRFSGRAYLYLGQSFGSFTVYNLRKGKVESFRSCSKDIPQEVLDFLCVIKKVSKPELDLPFFPEDENYCSSDAYCEIMGLITKKRITFDPARYYGEGESGRPLTEDQIAFIKETYGFKM
jgi:hypothetical protein